MQREAEEGWTNVEWFDWNLAHVLELRATGLVDTVIDAEQPPADVAAAIVAEAQQVFAAESLVARFARLPTADPVAPRSDIDAAIYRTP